MHEKTICSNCKAWDGKITDQQAPCLRNPPNSTMVMRQGIGGPEPVVVAFWPLTSPGAGCFSGIPKETAILNG